MVRRKIKVKEELLRSSDKARKHRVSFALNDREKEELNLRMVESGYLELSSYIRDSLLYERKINLDRIKSKIVLKISELSSKIKEERGESEEENMALRKMKKIIIENLIEIIKEIK